MVEKTPGQVAVVAHARAWALDPTRGGKKFRWNTKGAWTRCRDFYLGKLPAHELEGWCQNLKTLARAGARKPGP